MCWLNKVSHTKERRTGRSVIWPCPGPPKGDIQVGHRVKVAPEVMPQKDCPCLPLQPCSLIPTSQPFLFQPPASCLRLCSPSLFSQNPLVNKIFPTPSMSSVRILLSFRIQLESFLFPGKFRGLGIISWKRLLRQEEGRGTHIP